MEAFFVMSTGLVERTVGVDIMDNLAVAEGAEIDISTFREVDSPFAGAKTDTSVNGMMATRERMKHIDGLLARGRLPKRLVVENNDGIGSDENCLEFGVRNSEFGIIGGGFATGEEFGDVGGGGAVGDMLVDVDIDEFHRIAQLRKQLSAPRRLRR